MKQVPKWSEELGIAWEQYLTLWDKYKQLLADIEAACDLDELQAEHYADYKDVHECNLPKNR